MLVEDHTLVRQATRTLLEQQPSLQVVGEADDMAGALALIPRVRPDVVIIDIRLRGSSGIDLARAVGHAYPEIKIIALTAFGFDQYVRAMLRVGAKGYMLKDASGEELVRAVHEVWEGRSALSPEIGTRLIAMVAQEEQPRCPGITRGLTLREVEVLELFELALNRREIARRLGVSPKTVNTHVGHILSKFGQTRISAAVGEAVAAGILAPTPKTTQAGRLRRVLEHMTKRCPSNSPVARPGTAVNPRVEQPFLAPALEFSAEGLSMPLVPGR